jgi:hypothetical protein
MKFTGNTILLFTFVFSLMVYAGDTDIFWISDPVSPGEAAMAGGWRFDKSTKVQVARLKDTDAGSPSQAGYDIEGWHNVDAIQPDRSAFKFIIPGDLQQGIFACRVTAAGSTDTRLINTPDVWRLQGDNVDAAHAGGWLRAFGKCLSFSNVSASVVLMPVTGSQQHIKLVLKKVTPEELWAKLPESTAEGKYKVYVHNGYGGSSMWISAGQINIKAVNKPAEKIYNVLDYGVDSSVSSYYSWNPDIFAVKTDASSGLQAALDDAGKTGGIVYLPRGVYSCSKMLNIPENVTIRGEGRELTAIQWSDVDPPRPACIYGTRNFAIEDISLYALNHYAVIRGNSGIEQESGNIKIRNVILKADRFLTCESNRHYDNYKEILETRLNDTNRVGALNFGGSDIEIKNCDIYSSRLVLSLDKVSGEIVGNRFTSRPEHWNIFIRGANKLIFEENVCMDGGVSISNVHHSPHFDSKGVRQQAATPTFRASYVYCANNDFRDSYTKDRDGGVNSDFHSPVGLFFGKMLKAEAEHITFDGSFWSKPNDAMLGAAVIITDGKGAGQYRHVTDYDGDNAVVLDRPFDVVPDETSWIAVSKSIDHQIYVDNTIADAGNGIFFWCGGIESIACRNRIVRAGTVNVNSIWHGGFLPALNLQFMDNEILEGLNWGASYIHVRGSLIGAISYPPVYTFQPGVAKNEQKHYTTDERAPDYRGPMTMMQVIRNNKIHNNGSYYIGGMVKNALLDGNYVANSDVGVEVTNIGGRWQDWFEGGPESIMIRGTKQINVKMPVINKCGGETVIIE